MTINVLPRSRDADGVFLAGSRNRCVCWHVVIDHPAFLEKSPPQ